MRRSFLYFALVILAAVFMAGCGEWCDNEDVDPFANAGPDQTVQTGSVVSLDGSGSDSPAGELLSYDWTILSAPDGSTATLSDPAAIKPTFIADLDGDYLIELRVNAGVYLFNKLIWSKPDTVTITATTANIAPIADAGPDQNIEILDEEVTVNIDGRESFDPNGDDLEYLWEFVSVPDGSDAVLVDDTAAMTSFDADLVGNYVISLTVTEIDSGDLSDSDTVTINVAQGNLPPVADAGEDRTVIVDNLVVVDGSGSFDPNAGDELTYSWSFLTVPVGSTAVLADDDTAMPYFTPDLIGDYEVELTVSDGEFEDTDAAIITVVELIDFETNILPAFQKFCIVCHAPGKRAEIDAMDVPLYLTPELAYDSLMPDIDSSTDGDFLRVEPGSPNESMLVMRITNDGDVSVEPRMPLVGADSVAFEELIRQWILEGADEVPTP